MLKLWNDEAEAPKTEQPKGSVGYMKAGEAGRYLGISTQMLRRLANEGQIRSAKIGPRSTLFAVRDLERFVEDNMNKAGGLEPKQPSLAACADCEHTRKL